MPDRLQNIETINIHEEQQALLVTAQQAQSRRAGKTLFHGQGMRQTMVALLADAQLAEHEGPLEAFLHVLQGKVVIRWRSEVWQVNEGEQISLRPERHSVTAQQDSVITLTVLRHPSAIEETAKDNLT